MAGRHWRGGTDCGFLFHVSFFIAYCGHFVSSDDIYWYLILFFFVWVVLYLALVSSIRTMIFGLSCRWLWCKAPGSSVQPSPTNKAHEKNLLPVNASFPPTTMCDSNFCPASQPIEPVPLPYHCILQHISECLIYLIYILIYLYNIMHSWFMFVSVSSSFHVSHVHNILVRSEGFTASSAFGHGQLRSTERFRRRIKLLVVPISTVGQGGIYGRRDTVDGRNPAPVNMANTPLFTGFYTSQVVQDFFHQQYGKNGIVWNCWYWYIDILICLTL